MSKVTIYHNPRCGTSRNTLALIRHCGIEPTVIEYLQTPPSRAELQALIARMDCPVREVLRQKGTPYDELDLGNPRWTPDELLDFIWQNSSLLNRTFVATPRGVRLCRTSEAGLPLLPQTLASPFTKEDGEVVGIS